MDYTYITLTPLFADKNGRLKDEYTYEGLHLKPEAYVIWVDYLKKMKYL
jgi:lysophospholipase L1-like esterase